MRGKKARAEKRNDRIKGNIVEQIVEQMHRVRGVTVERNVRLCSTQNPKRRREIDVLVSGQVIGYPVRFAFECKNYDKAIDVAKIGEFVDKLHDVGIAPQNGVFVSASGFTAGALDRAKQIGMQTLLLAGLADDRLGSLVIDALQSVVYLLPVVTQWTVINSHADVNSEEMWVWYDEDGRAVANTPDLLWHRWLDGEPASIIGVHEIKVDAPGWSQRVSGNPAVPIELRFTVHVYGLVITLSGRASDHRLFDGFNHEMKKRQVNVTFDTPSDTLPLRAFETEEEFKQFIAGRSELVKVINRVRLPRLQWNGLFWPVSARARRELDELAKEKGADAITAEDFAAVERHSLGSVWELPASVPPRPGST